MNLNKKNTRNRLASSEKKKILNEVEEGMPIPEAAKKYSVTERNIKDWKRSGVKDLVEDDFLVVTLRVKIKKSEVGAHEDYSKAKGKKLGTHFREICENLLSKNKKEWKKFLE